MHGTHVFLYTNIYTSIRIMRKMCGYLKYFYVSPSSILPVELGENVYISPWFNWLNTWWRFKTNRDNQKVLSIFKDAKYMCQWCGLDCCLQWVLSPIFDGDIIYHITKCHVHPISMRHYHKYLKFSEMQIWFSNLKAIIASCFCDNSVVGKKDPLIMEKIFEWTFRYDFCKKLRIHFIRSDDCV